MTDHYIVSKKLTYGDCLKKNRTALIKYIICKAIDLKLQCLSGQFKNQILYGVNILLMAKSENELLEIITNGNDEIKSMCLKSRRRVIRMKRMDFASESESESEDESDSFSHDIDPDVTVLRQLNMTEWMKKRKMELIKYIIAKMADLELFSYDDLIPDGIDERIEDELCNKNKHKLAEILMNENNELQSIYSKLVERKKKDDICEKHLI